MRRDLKLIETLNGLFAERLEDGCLTSSNVETLLIIEDDTDRSTFTVFREGNSSVGFLIENPNRKTINLLSADHCFFGESEPARCDCIVFDDTCICFAELKLNVVKRKTATNNLKTARTQLGTTIEFFKTALASTSPSIFDFALEAYVIMRGNVYPRHRGRQAVFVRFLEKYGVKLIEANQKMF